MSHTRASFSRSWRFFAIPVVALLIHGGQSLPAGAGILMEADWQGNSVKAEIATNFDRVRVEINDRSYVLNAETRRLHDFKRDVVHNIDELDSFEQTRVLPYTLRSSSGGPPVAGHRTRYSVLRVDELICAEVLDSGWMTPFMSNVVQALRAIQKVETELAPIDRGVCGAASFDTYAQNGWPLVIGWRDSEIFRTTNLRFDHKPDTNKFALPIDLETDSSQN